MKVDDDVLTEFGRFFRAATGHEPYPYQAGMAREGLPRVLEATTGSGKTGVALAWAFRRLLHPDQAVREATPRRLIYALPMRTLVESVTGEISRWISRAGLGDQVQVRQLMGGTTSTDDLNRWRMALERPSIVVGTVDQIVSRQLMRGYGISRRAYPVDFALTTADAHVIVDEIQLAGQATTTARQVEAFLRRFGAVGNVGLTCMSATIEEAYLDTVDNPLDVARDVVRLTDADRRGPLAVRLAGTRRIRELADVSKDAQVAAHALAQHRSGTLTLVVVNRVDEAVEVHRELAKQMRQADIEPEMLLVHSRFRGIERAALNAELRRLTTEEGRHALAAGSGCIVIATQAVEAGIDLDATTLITEAAPWMSVCQRAGRCNRAGLMGAGDDTQAALFWFTRGKAAPYDADDVTSAIEALTALEGRAVTSEDLLAAGGPVTPEPLSILRAPTMLQLFDTSPDMTGVDIDVSRYIRPDDGRDVEVAWVDAPPTPGSREKPPTRPWRVSVPAGLLYELVKRKDRPRVWFYDSFAQQWSFVRSVADLHTGRLVLVDRTAGGYDTLRGFDPKCQIALRPDEVRSTEPAVGEDGDAEGTGDDQGSFAGAWQPLAEHLEWARVEAREVCRAVDPAGQLLTPDIADAVVAATYLHDVGKAFRGWQQGLRACTEAVDDDGELRMPGSDEIVAKAPGLTGKRRRLRGSRPLIVRADPVAVGSGTVADPAARPAGLRRTTFRHELASLLMLRSDAGREALRSLGVPEDRVDLALYLVAAHHGALRVRPRDPVHDGRDGAMVLGVVPGEGLPAVTVGAITLPETEADLSFFDGGEGSWGLLVARLLDEFGPFRLAYLETLVRMSDWRASAALDADKGVQK